MKQRISMRIKDSLEKLKRNDLINKIDAELNTKLGLKKDEYKLTGVLILFNNLLQSLFKSQILTLGIVIVGIFFNVLFYLEILQFLLLALFQILLLLYLFLA